jgi:hypothetical protein
MRSPLPVGLRLRLPDPRRVPGLLTRRARGPAAEPDRDTATDAGCAECGGRAVPDQRVPDPAQFIPDPRRDGNTPVKELATVDAPMVWCGRCRTWLHAIGCHSVHHEPGWKPFREPSKA